LHELSIAQSVVSAVLLEAEKNNASHVKEINLDVGELMQLETDVLADALNMLMTGEKLNGAKVSVHVKSALFSCRRCGNRWDMSEVKRQLERVPDSLLVREPDSKEVPLHFFPYLYSSFANCPKCGSTDVATLDGDDIKLRTLILE
jgi:hydrogenase nickel insertion protein HypA